MLAADLARFTNPAKGHAELTRHWPSMLRVLVSQQGAWAVAEYRFRRWGRSTSGAALFRVIGFFTRKIVEIATGVSLPSTAEIGPGLYIGHFGEVIVGGDVKVGADCNLSQGVTLGEYRHQSPIIGDGVYIAPGAKVFGGIRVGDGAKIGANAVVNTDVPAGATAVGVPARIVR